MFSGDSYFDILRNSVIKYMGHFVLRNMQVDRGLLSSEKHPSLGGFILVVFYKLIQKFVFFKTIEYTKELHSNVYSIFIYNCPKMGGRKCL